MINTKDAAQGKWYEIYDYYGLSHFIHNSKHFKCPFCENKAFRIAPKKIEYGGWICSCRAGDGFNLLIQTTGKEYAELAKEINNLIGHEYKSNKIQDNKKFKKKILSARGTVVQDYLRTRRILQMPQKALGYTVEAFAGERYQTMIGMVSNELGQLCYYHKTLLDGPKKADLSDSDGNYISNKRLEGVLEHSGSIAIRLFDQAHNLCLCEGIESALSANIILKMPAWATVNTTFMARLLVPKGVKKLTIWADSDWHGAGMKSAYVCANKNLLNKNNDVDQVRLIWGEIDKDANDHLISGGNLFEWTLKK